MQTRYVLVSLALATAIAGCATPHTVRPSRIALADCANLGSHETVAALYTPGKVTRVEPTYRQEFLARAIQPRYVSGANLYVAAEPGVNRAFLERALTCHAASTANLHPSDPLRAEGVVAVTVSEAGPAMRIRVVGANRRAGKAIWERALTLRAAQGEVSVEQLSSAPFNRQL